MARYERQEKPYDFVEFGELYDKDRRSPSGHNKYHDNALSGIFHGEIEALSPVHVASGQMELTGDQRTPLIKTHTSRNSKTIIPGSSLKGCIRSIVEAISASCVSITRAYYDQLPKKTTACKNKEELCVACRLFGSMEYLGKVRFSDAVLQEGFSTSMAFIPQLYSPRSRQRIYLDREDKVKGRKFYQHGTPASGDTPIEVCPEGSRFNFTMSFDNLTKAELGLLLVAMGRAEPKLYPKLGGAKPACYGSVKIFITKSKILEDMKDAYLQYDAETISVDIDECVAAAKEQELILEKQLNQLVGILNLDSKKQCPSRNY